MGFDFVTVNDPCSGEYVSGDGAVIHEFEHGLLVVIIDVLGHGEKAAKTARAMESYIKELCSSDIVWLMEKVHEHFLTSQGAAMTMVYFDRLTHQLNGVAIGNTLLRRCGEEWQHLVTPLRRRVAILSRTTWSGRRVVTNTKTISRCF